MERAFAAIAIFFPGKHFAIQLSDRAEGIRHCLADNKVRPEHPHDRRMDTSNLELADRYWSQMDHVYKTMRRRDNPYHRDWDKITRPLIAHWFKSGVISPGYLSNCPSAAVVLTEPGRKSTLR